jgi:phosphoserine phosphatase RsbU/P
MGTPTPPSTARASQNVNRRPGLFVQLDKFWQRVTEGLELNQLWRQFQADARASYRLYQRDFTARAPQEIKRQNFFETAQEFAWALLEKLTPARRVLLLIGVLLLIFPGGGFAYHGKSGEVQVAEFDFHFFGGLVIFIVLMLEVADRVVMKRDLEIARDIQKWLLPATAPLVPGLAIAFSTRPANTVAGDYYDVFARPTTDGTTSRFLLTIADVAGKSMPAALLMATFQASLKTLSSVPCSLGELVAGMNRYASSNSQGGLRFVTGFFAEYDPAVRNLTYINAGHNAPILRRQTGAIEHLSAGGLPLGILTDAAYQSETARVEAGDWLVIFTDGLVEALNSRGEEYGEHRVLNMLQSGISASPDELLRRIMSDLDFFVGDTPQHDDVTCMLVKVLQS